MNMKHIRELGKAMNTLEQQRKALQTERQNAREELRDLDRAIVDRLKFKQYDRWSRYNARHPKLNRFETLSKFTKNKELLAMAERCLELITEANSTHKQYCAVLDALDRRDNLTLVISNPYNWYDLTVRKLSRVLPRRNDRKKQLHLSLVR